MDTLVDRENIVSIFVLCGEYSTLISSMCGEHSRPDDPVVYETDLQAAYYGIYSRTRYPKRDGREYSVA